MNRPVIALMFVVALVTGCARQEAEEAAEPDMALAARQFRKAALRHGLEVTGVDTSNVSHLEAELGDRKSARIAWAGMGRDTEASADALDRRMTHLKAAMESESGSRLTRFTATEPSRVFAFDDEEPAGRPPAPSGTANRVHVVEEGEDLYAIAMMWGVSVVALKRENDLTGGRVHPGDRLSIPMEQPADLTPTQHESQEADGHDSMYEVRTRYTVVGIIRLVAAGIVSLLQVAIIVVCLRRGLRLLGCGFMVTLVVGAAWGLASPYLQMTSPFWVSVLAHILLAAIAVTGPLLILMFAIRHKPPVKDQENGNPEGMRNTVSG